MKKILVCGDSFAVNYAEFDKNSHGWSNLLAKDNYDVTNLAQAGVGEYKIFKQLTSVDLEKFDAVVICHTSPNRVYIRQHPVYNDSKLHKNADLIYSDVEWHLEQDKNNRVLATAKDYFDKIYDQLYHEDIYCLIQNQIEYILQAHTRIHLTPLYDKNNNNLTNCINLHILFDVLPGAVNHYSLDDNKQIYSIIKLFIDNNA
jgi:hypothetical protein